MNKTLRLHFAMELLSHLSDQEQEYIISVIISILSGR